MNTKRVAIVTGARQGLGQTIVERLEARDVECLCPPPEVNFKGKREIEAWCSAFDAARATLLVNNFAINHLSWIGETEEEDEAIFRVNVMAPYWFVNWRRANADYGCRVLNIASQTYRVPQRTTALYCASKAALVQMTRVMARELAPHNWVVNALAPGKILGTEMTMLTDLQVEELRDFGNREEAESYAKGLIPAGRFTNREEVARMAVQLLLDTPDYVNGAVIDMMGGV